MLPVIRKLLDWWIFGWKCLRCHVVLSRTHLEAMAAAGSIQPTQSDKYCKHLVLFGALQVRVDWRVYYICSWRCQALHSMVHYVLLALSGNPAYRLSCISKPLIYIWTAVAMITSKINNRSTFSSWSRWRSVGHVVRAGRVALHGSASNGSPWVSCDVENFANPEQPALCKLLFWFDLIYTLNRPWWIIFGFPFARCTPLSVSKS